MLDRMWTPMLVVGMTLPLIGSALYRAAGRREGGWGWILVVYYGFSTCALLMEATERVLLHGPTWPQLAFLMVMSAGVLIGLGFAIAAVDIRRRAGRAAARSDSGRCGQCGYDLTGNRSGTCPECGAAVERRARRRCSRCWFDLTDRSGDACPVCGATVTSEAPV